MITVLFEAGNDEAALSASLATLVAGAVEGLVREVVVLDAGLDPGTRRVADHAGCQVVDKAKLAEAVNGARGDWLMLLEPGARLPRDWVEEVVTHLADGEVDVRTPRAARFSRSKRDRPTFWERFGRRRTALSEGLILPKAQAVGLAKRAASLEAMAQGIASTRLGTAIRPRVTSRR